jgi:D-psicose/D-tagatose/L-ribulose 3-epimerase
VNKIGVSSGFYGKDWPVEFTASIRKAAKLGFDAIELFTAGMLGQPKQKLQDYAKQADELGIELQYCAGLTPEFYPASKDGSVRKNAVEYLKKTLELIGFLKGRIFGGVNYIAWGSRLDNLREKPFYRERSIKSLKEVMPTAEGLGITYCVEPTNRFEQFLLNTVTEGNAFVEEVGSSSLKLTLDTFHLSIEEDNIAEAAPARGKEHRPHALRQAQPPLSRARLHAVGRDLPSAGQAPLRGTLGMEPFIIPEAMSARDARCGTTGAGEPARRKWMSWHDALSSSSRTAFTSSWNARYNQPDVVRWANA